MEVFSLRNLCEQLVRVSQPCTGGSVGRVTLSQHLILWEKENYQLGRLKALVSGERMKLINLTSLLSALSCSQKYVSIRKKKQLLFICTEIYNFDP